MIFKDLEPQDLENMTNLLRETASTDQEVALAAQSIFAAELQTPLRKGIISGDIISDIFEATVFDPNARTEYPIDFYRPDNASEFVAYTIPAQGKIPQKHVEGDYVTVPTYDIGGSIDYLLRYAQDARWDIVGRAMEVLEAMFTKKMNDDGWHNLMAAAYDRNILVSDTNASAGQFTKRLVSLMQLVMRRNGGGNSVSINRTKLTHLFLSPEAMEDMRNWGVDEVDEVTRREIFVADDGSFSKIFGVILVDLDELGEGQEYQDYYETVTAAGAANSGMASGDVEIVVGLDLSKRDSFVMPIRDELEVHPDPTLHRERKAGMYAWASLGFGVLNNTRILLGSL